MSNSKAQLTRSLVDVFRDMEGGQRGLPTGFPSLDEIVAGLEPGNFIVLAGRPSLGKTALAVSLVRHLALHRKEPVGVAYFYLEANRKDIGCRLLAAEGVVIGLLAGNLAFLREVLGGLGHRETAVRVEEARHQRYEQSAVVDAIEHPERRATDAPSVVAEKSDGRHRRDLAR